MDNNELSMLAKALADAGSAVKEANEVLKNAKEKERRLREEIIPEKMTELGFEEIKLDSGEKIVVFDQVYAKIPDKSREAAFDWLTKNGFDGLIKTKVSVQYSRGEAKQASLLYQELCERGLPVELKEDVHPQTLAAFLREQIAEGLDIPLELFGAYQVKSTKVKGK